MKNEKSVVLVLMLWLAGTAAAQHEWDEKELQDVEVTEHRVLKGVPRAGCGEMHGPDFHKRGPGDLAGLIRLSKELELSESQIEQLREMQFEFQLMRIDQQASIKKAKVRLNRLMRDDQAPEMDVLEAIDAAAAAKAELKKLQFSHRKAMLSSLTEEQREKFEQLRLERRSGPEGDEKPHKLKKMRKRRSRSGG